jgi:type IV pilus assembly protein PilY1
MLAGAVGAACAMSATSLLAQAGAVIDNGTVRLGVNNTGNLNFDPPGAAPSPAYSGVGIQHVPTGYDATYAGCECEGWGAGISGGAFNNVWGGADESAGRTNVFVQSFSSTSNTATSVVTIRSGGTDIMRVSHAYAPSAASPNLYQVTVTIENLTAGELGVGATGIRYRRVMDWDIPFPGMEVSRLRGWGATNLLATSSNGFAGPNPFDLPGTRCSAPVNSNFDVTEPCDHGALFDFGFPSLAAGSSRTFVTFYGAASSVDEMRAALGAAGAEVYSLAYCGEAGPVGSGLPNCSGTGAPSVFAFGFQGVGGNPVEPPPVGVVPEPSTVVLMATGLAGLFVGVRRRRQQA